MTRLYPRLLAASSDRGRRTLGAVLAAAALGGCGASGSGDVNQAAGDAARAAQAVTQLSQKAVRSWCSAGLAGDGHRLTQAQARDCLRRAWNGWLGELKHNGYDARAIAQGK